jgi:hypothetical protein
VSVIKVATFDRAHLLVGYDNGGVRVRLLDKPEKVVFNYKFDQKIRFVNFVTGSFCLLLVVLEDGSIQMVTAKRNPDDEGCYFYKDEHKAFRHLDTMRPPCDW